jgi:hypothetical protein
MKNNTNNKNINSFMDININNKEYINNKVDYKKIGFKKDYINYLYLIPYNMDFKVFKDELLGMKFIKEGKLYAFLIKVKRTDGSFKMAGNHEIWNSEKLSKKTIQKMFEKILLKINNLIEDYTDEEIELIQIMYIELNPVNSLKLKNINKIKLNKEIIKVGETKKQFNDNYIPFTMNLDYYGKKLKYKTNEKGYINEINLNGINIYENIVFDYDNPGIKGGSQIILKKIKDPRKFHIYLYTRNFKARYNEFNKNIHRENILIINEIENNQRVIEVFEINDIEKRFGSAKFICIDTSLNNDFSEFIRNINDFTLYISKDKVMKYEKKLKLSLIKYKNQSENKHVRNTNIGVLDLETYYDSNKNKSFTYAIGFKIFKGESKLFYKKIDQSSNDLIIECINSMLVRAYGDYIFYVHNLHGYDSIFILSALLDYNTKNPNHYKIKTIFRDNRIIKLEIRIKTGKKSTRKITFVDSYLMLNASLKKLQIDFDCEGSKGHYPYLFVNKNNLYYIGKTPDKIYYTNLSETEYQKIITKNWNCKEETLIYLEKDLDLLLEVVDKFSKYIYLNYGLQITDCLTISKLSINILYSNYIYKLENSTQTNGNLPLINQPTIYNFIKESYFGGITEVYIPKGKNLIYYDINSEYPFVSKNSMPGNLLTYMELQEDAVIKGKTLDLENLFGFFYCKVKTKNDYLGLLPLHINNKLVLPNGEFYGTWFTEELKFAKENGYEIQVIKGYNFNKIENVFDKFVDDLYNIKTNAKGVVKSITKLILNSSFGRFGMSIFKPETEIVNKNKLEMLLCTRKILDTKQLNNDTFIVNYLSQLSKETIEQAGLDITKIIKNKEIESFNKFGFVSISTASAITAYARIYINKIKLLLLKNGAKIYYSDTDSIVTDMKLPDEFVGQELGKFKLEYNIKKAIFITSKTYVLILEDGTIIKKAKGVNTDSLTLNDFENMFYNNKKATALKTHTNLDIVKGTVNISTKSVLISPNSYTKREKIYNDKGLWINTKPIFYK